MDAEATRLTKEVKQMLWPCAAVTLAGALSFAHPAGSGTFSPAVLLHLLLPLGMFVGIPLLASLSAGYEFQYRTFSLLMAQPVDRRQLWREKILTTMVAVAIPATLFFLSASSAGSFPQGERMFAACWMVATAAGAMFWVLVARSTMGGLALNSAIPSVMLLGWSYAIAKLRASGHDPENLTMLVVAVLILYAGTMLWLGRRAFLRYQAVDGANDDVVVAITSRLAPRALVEWVRCRPRRPVLNLLRRDLRLLRPVWLLVVVNLLTWISLVVFGLLPARGEATRNVSGAGLGLLVVATLLSVTSGILAGTLALGEEKTLGTHQWHMTLPLSVRVQWVVRLCVALLAGPVCGGLLPALLLVGLGAAYGSPFRFAEPNLIWTWPMALALLTIVAFWCAALVKSTVKAALWVFPAFFGFLLAAEIGDWAADRLTTLAAAPIGALLMNFDPFRVAGVYWTIWEKLAPGQRPEPLIALWLVPTLAVALASSYGLFRGQAEEGRRYLARALAPVLGIALLCSFTFWVFFDVAGQAHKTKAMLLRETHQAIQRTQLGTMQRVSLTPDELAKASPLSPETRQWLQGSTIVVSMATLEGARNFAGRCGPYSSCFPIYSPSEGASSYVATIERADRSKCRLAFESTAFARSQGPAGILAGTCER